MTGFNYEKDLPHQIQAIESIVQIFQGVTISYNTSLIQGKVCNPQIRIQKENYTNNIKNVQCRQGIDKSSISIFNADSNILDISMETGTGKTYTYTKAMFELNRTYNIWKFIVVVPTLSIKAGTVSFLRSHETKKHFRGDYHKNLKVHVVKSQKSKSKRKYMPQAINEFVEATDQQNSIHVLIINAGMINSPLMKTIFDRRLFDKHSNPFEALSSIHPITFIDEPHKFPKEKKTWDNIQKINSQYIFRFGATFSNNYENLIHELTAIEAFNQDLVKGVVTYVEEFEEGNGISVKLLRLFRNEPTACGKNNKIIEAVFELNLHEKKKHFKLAKGESLSIIHPEMKDLIIENLNQSVALLSNGLELRPGNTINPYSYSESLQDKMIENAIKRHFEIEKSLLTRQVKIKPLSLFFIDDIEGYRNNFQITRSLKNKFENLVKAHVETLLKTVTNNFYRNYLQKTLNDLSAVHGGYFSKDNSGNDEKIEQEIKEILHDRESLLSLENPRRFIFSKWTLREGWDNPNVFQICKIRSSGSQTSKLQEVGRGLRLPVNEYMSRVKDETFDLHYYVDFTESDFADSLVNEINLKSDINQVIPTTLNNELVQKVMAAYPKLSKNDILVELDEANAINRSNDFKPDGYNILKKLYPLAYSKQGIKSNKIRVAGKKKKQATLRLAKYNELKELWEAINQRVILEYKISSEKKFKDIIQLYFLTHKSNFKPQGSITRCSKLKFTENRASITEEKELDNEVLPIVTMSYKSFLLELGRILSVNINTLHQVFFDIQKELDINNYLSFPTINYIKNGFNKYLLDNAFNKYHIGYKEVSNQIHPTAFTNNDGIPYTTIDASNLGIQLDELKKPVDQYLFEEVFYDSDLEKDNIVTIIKEVKVFTKIPKNSIRIPVAGGGTYSPDFAYIVEYNNGKKSLNLIVEVKGKDKRTLSIDETQKIMHAEALFNTFSDELKISFKTQFNIQEIKEVIRSAIIKN